MAAWFSSVGLLLIFALTNGYAYKILFMLPFCTKSHKLAFDPVAKELGNRGHEVTVLSSVVTTKNSANVENILLKGVADIMETVNLNFFTMTMGNFSLFQDSVDSMAKAAHETFESAPVADFLLHPKDSEGKPRFDVVVIDAIGNEPYLALAHHLNVPAVYIAPTVLWPPIGWNLNIPQPAYVPWLLPPSEDNLTFLDRAISSLLFLFMLLVRSFYSLPVFDAVIRQHLPNSPPLVDLEKNVSFMITNSHFSIHPRIPTMPYIIEAGGLHCLLSQKLPKDFEDFIQSSGDDGVIYFSIGTVTKDEFIPPDMLEKITQVFQKLPQKILWKSDKSNSNLTKDKFKFSSWMPQQDILGHPKTRLFLSHGGGLSTQEAAYHGCPMVTIPLFYDQHSNAMLAGQKGFSLFLDWKTFTTDELFSKINLVLNNKSFRENALSVSRLIKDRPLPPAEEAAYWIEYVIRHKGAPHLKSGAEKLNFFQYFLLDVIAAVVSVFLIAIAVAFWLLRKCCQMLCRFFTSSGGKNGKSDKHFQKKKKH